jgi:hypothetical protein
MNIDQSKQVRRRASIAALTVALALLSVAPGVSTASAASQTGPVAQTTSDRAPNGGAPVSSFIMSDGRICDPIRHMGC